MISGNDFGPNYNQTLTESSLTATTRTAEAITHCEQPIPCSEVKSPNNTHADLVCEVSAPSMDDDDVYYYSCGRIVSKKNSCFFFDTLTLNFLFFLDRCSCCCCCQYHEWGRTSTCSNRFLVVTVSNQASNRYPLCWGEATYTGNRRHVWVVYSLWNLSKHSHIHFEFHIFFFFPFSISFFLRQNISPISLVHLFVLVVSFFFLVQGL